MGHAWRRGEVFTGFWLGGLLREVGINGANWILLAQDRVWRQSFVA